MNVNTFSHGNMPLVSVVVPSYNHSAYINNCLQSIFEQDYPNKQVIVIDDGSIDDSPEILRDLQGKFEFELVVQPNHGLLPTLNKALAMAKGEFFVPFASDDIMLPGRLSRQVAHFQKHPEVAICGGNVVPIGINGDRLGNHISEPARRLDFDAVFFGTMHGAPAPSMMLRTAVVRDVGGYEESLGVEDLLMMLKVTRAGYLIDVLATEEACYRQHEGNMHSRHEYMFYEVLNIYKLFAEHPGYDSVVTKHCKSYFLKASKKSPRLAKKVLKEIPVRKWDIKVLRGILHMRKNALRDIFKARYNS